MELQNQKQERKKKNDACGVLFFFTASNEAFGLVQAGQLVGARMQAPGRRAPIVEHNLLAPSSTTAGAPISSP